MRLRFVRVFCTAETTARAIEDAFKEFTGRDDIAVVLINQYVRCNERRIARPPAQKRLSAHVCNRLRT